jgi:hypothetical protein
MVAAMSLEDEWKCENEEVERIGSEQWKEMGYTELQCLQKKIIKNSKFLSTQSTWMVVPVTKAEKARENCGVSFGGRSWKKKWTYCTWGSLKHLWEYIRWPSDCMRLEFEVNVLEWCKRIELSEHEEIRVRPLLTMDHNDEKFNTAPGRK